MSLSELSKEEKDEACVTFAALLLHGAGAEVTSEKLAEVIKASGNDVEAYWCPLFAKLFNKVDIEDLILRNTQPGAGGGGGGGDGGGDAGGGGGEDSKEEAKKEEVEEEEIDMGGGGDLFGGDDEEY